MAPMDPSRLLHDDTEQSVDEAPVNQPHDAAEERALVRRLDLILMPAIWVMYLFSYADRTK